VRLFAYLVVLRDHKGEWMDLLNNLRVRVMLKKPTQKRADEEKTKWGRAQINHDDNNSNTAKPKVDGKTEKKDNNGKEEDGEEDDASFVYVGNLLAHDVKDVDVAGTEILELERPGSIGLFSRPGFCRQKQRVRRQ
jgi:hypothetical protein